MSSDNVILNVTSLLKYYPVWSRGIILKRRVGNVHAVDNVSFSVKKGETFGLVGESGCGKTTTAKLILHLEYPDMGEVYFEGKNVTQTMLKGTTADRLALRRRMQYVFQNPYASLDPRMTVADIILEPMSIHHHLPMAKWKDRLFELIHLVGLEDYHVERYPHEFSGGQRQRICIARALAVEPDLIVTDEPVASLDVSIRAQVLNLLEDLQNKFGLTYVYISHDLSTVRHVSDRVAVMYLGKFVELADVTALYSEPLHPYTEALMSAIPVPDPTGKSKEKRIILRGEVPSPINPPVGCRFHPRCNYAMDICRKAEPALEEVKTDHFVACFLHHKTKAKPVIYAK
ncbi:MAG: ABC transporter ATP-binding protein [Promethearchaeati archaeon SRVP18_Atabeyarchaeia-1]